jgi:hypothetical protein
MNKTAALSTPLAIAAMAIALPCHGGSVRTARLGNVFLPGERIELVLGKREKLSVLDS